MISCGSTKPKKREERRKRRCVTDGGDGGIPVVCGDCEHPITLHKALSLQWESVKQVGAPFYLVRLARVAVSAFSSPTWCLQALLALESLCKTENATPTEVFFSKVRNGRHCFHLDASLESRLITADEMKELYCLAL